MHKPSLISVLIAGLLLGACSSDPEQSRAVPVQIPTNPNGSPVTGILTADFDPSIGVVPTPNNLVFLGSTDGTLNIPVANPADFGNPQVALNALDGWSTVAPMSTGFSNTVNASTVVTGQTVRVIEVVLCSDPDLGCPPVAGPPIGVVGELTPGADFIALINPADPTQRQLVIIPTRPLNAKSAYLVVLTNGIADPAGNAATPSQVYNLLKRTSPLVDGSGNSTVPPLPNSSAQALEPLRILTNAQESIAEAVGIPRASIVLSWTVSTQSIGDVLSTFAATVDPADHLIIPTGQPTNVFTGAPVTFASVYVGHIEVTYGLQAPDDLDPIEPDPTRILSGHWNGIGGSNLTRFNPFMVPRSDRVIPVLMTIPSAPAVMPVAGWPVVIFQHGITGNRTNMLGMADAAAAAGFAVIAIDQPLHGVTSAANPFYASGTDVGAPHLHFLTGTNTDERTFDVDLVDNATGAPGPDGIIDGSGAHFINLPRLLTSRDNLRQASADILTVAATIPTMSTVDAQTFDGTRIHFVGHSLGGIVGTAAIASGDSITAATLGMPGGGIARMLEGSVTFGPVVQGGLAAQGVLPGSAAYNAFFFAAQTVIDSADPINYGAAAAENAAIHMIAVVGDGTQDNLPDQVVPVAVPGQPLSGTNPLAAVMGLDEISGTTFDAAGVRGIVRFITGDHSSLLSPAGSAAAFTEMQHQLANFMGSSGTLIDIANDAVILQPQP